MVSTFADSSAGVRYTTIATPILYMGTIHTVEKKAEFRKDIALYLGCAAIRQSTEPTTYMDEKWHSI